MYSSHLVVWKPRRGAVQICLQRGLLLTCSAGNWQPVCAVPSGPSWAWVLAVCMYAQLLSHVRLFATPWTVAHQAPLSMEFSRQEYWSGLPFPSPGNLSNPRIEPRSLACRQILYHLSHQGSPKVGWGDLNSDTKEISPHTHKRVSRQVNVRGLSLLMMNL